MNIALVFFSHMGHTKKAGEAVAGQLTAEGHHVNIFGIQPKEKLNLRAEEVEIKNQPEISSFDVLILGTPVHGGRMSAPIFTFLDQMPIVNGLRTVLLLTHFFRKEWGALQTIQSLEVLCKTKGLDVLGYANVKWFSFYRNRNIQRAVE
ncbi:MAG: flavodoxin family protein, partial [Anaerolineales bacterium]